MGVVDVDYEGYWEPTGVFDTREAAQAAKPKDLSRDAAYTIIEYTLNEARDQ